MTLAYTALAVLAAYLVGSLSFAVTVEGKQGHAAYPHKADNPIPKLARLIDRISHARLDDGNEHFDPSTLAVTSFDVGNPAGNVIPSRAVAKFNIRFSPVHSFDSLRAWVDQQIAAGKAVAENWDKVVGANIQKK